MVEPLSVLQGVVEAALMIYKMVDGAQSNRQKCKELSKRVSAIVQVLEGNHIHAYLSGLATGKVPEALLLLKEAVAKCKDFIEKYGKQNTLIKYFNYQGIMSAFEDVNVQLDRATHSAVLLLTAASAAAGASPPPAPKLAATEAEMHAAIGNDALEEFATNPNMSVVIWVDSQPGNNKLIIKNIMSQSGIFVASCQHTSDLKQLLFIHRGIIQSAHGRLRFITNRARPDAAGGPINEKAYQDLLQIRKEFGITTPIMVYTGLPATANAINTEVQCVATENYVMATSVKEVVTNFACFSTVLYVWKGPIAEEEKKVVDQLPAQGILLEKVDTVDAAVDFLRNNQGLLQSKYLRIVTHRLTLDLGKELEDLGCAAPVLVYTGSPNLQSAKKDWSKWSFVHVTASDKDFKDFVHLSSKFDPPAGSPQLTGSGSASGIASLSATSAASAASVKHSQVHITLSGLRCENLYPTSSHGKSDPYVKITADNGVAKLGQTSVQKKTLSPSWDTTFQWSRWSSEVLQFQVWDDELLNKDAFNGECFIPVMTFIEGLTPGDVQQSEHRLKLLARPGKQDKVSGFLCFTVEAKITSQ